MHDAVPLATIAKITSGKRPIAISKERIASFTIPVVGGGGISGFTTEALYDGEVLVTGRVGTLGKLFALSEPCWPSDNALVVRPSSTLTDPKFLRYALQLRIEDAAGMNRGAANPLITQKDLGRLLVYHPSIEHQAAIANVLCSLDDKIELNRRINETLEEMAQAIFRDWFVYFGPTQRKLDGGTDPVEIMGGLVVDPDRARELADLFPARIGNDGLPEGWQEKPFSFLLEDTIGGDWGKEAPEGDENHPVAIIRGTDFPALLEGGIGKVPLRFTTARKANRRRLQERDIVLEVSGGSPTQPTGRSIWVAQSILERFECDVVCASFCRRFRPTSPAASLVAWAHLINLYREGGTWKYQNQSTGISNFQTTHFLDTEQVIWGGNEVAEAFSSIVEPMAKLANRNENLSLSSVRDFLLPKLMSGEVRLRDAQREVEAVA